MKTIAITSHGTLGDNLPLIALGQSLKQRGHEVIMAISPPMHSYALKVGLKVAANGRVLGKQEALQRPHAWNHLDRQSAINVTDESFYHQFRTDLANGLSCLLNACKNVDAIISAPQQNLISAMVRDKYRIPIIRAFVAPSFCCAKKKKTRNESLASLDYLNERIYGIVEEILQSQDLSFPYPKDWKKYFTPQHYILGSSSHFSQPTTKQDTQFIQTGFWFYEEPDWANWQPNPNLKEFMEREPKPLVLSFSSQPLTDAEARAVVEVHVRAAAKLERPILIQQGWADFTVDLLPPDCDRNKVMFAGFMPQDWLFSRAAALIHHGGIGTTARALRNGCPMLIEPYGNDQFFNAKQIVLHGVGAAVHPVGLEVDELTRVLRDKVLTPDYKNRAVEMGTKIRQEKGLETACNAIENWL